MNFFTHISVHQASMFPYKSKREEMDRVVKLVGCCKEGRKNENWKNAVALLTKTSSVIAKVEVSEALREENARLQGVKLRQSHE